MPISEEELNNLLSGKSIDGGKLKKTIKPLVKTENYNVIIPVTITGYKKIPGFKLKLGQTTQDIKTKNSTEFLFNRNETFKAYLRDYSKGVVDVIIIGEVKNIQIWQLLSGFDPNYVYIYNGNKYKEKHPVDTWFDVIQDILNPKIEIEEIEEPIKKEIKISHQPLIEQQKVNIKKTNILEKYLNKLNGNNDI